MKKYIMIIVAIFFIGCVKLPDGVTPVENFDIDRYLGKWYEIARFDHSFEKGMSNVSAEYTKDKDSIKVLNKGYFDAKKEWREATAKAYLAREEDEGFLKVSFFRPFYNSYIIIELGENYEYSLVSGPNKGYLWILSRTPHLDENIIKKLIKTASKLGFDTDALIYVDQNR